MSADGKRLGFANRRDQSDVFIADMNARGTELLNVRRITADERVDWPGAWADGGESLLFYSDRNGTLDVFRQGIDDRTAQAIVSSADEERTPELSLDRAWILYQAWSGTPEGVDPTTGRLMRLPVGGGVAEKVMDLRGYPGSARTARIRQVLNAKGHPDIRCPQRQGDCVLSESQPGRIMFTAFDPVHGRKREITRLEFEPDTNLRSTAWALSPDGASIAFVLMQRTSGAITVLPVAGGTSSTIHVKDWTNLDAVAWGPDGSWLVANSYSTRGGTLLRVSLNGETRILRRSSAWHERPVVSPDGRRLAFAERIPNSNAWILEGL
jgi:Tol biopolymer transport system component